MSYRDFTTKYFSIANCKDSFSYKCAPGFVLVLEENGLTVVDIFLTEMKLGNAI